MLASNIELRNGIWRGNIQLHSWEKFFKHNQSIELCVGGDRKVENIADWHIRTYEYLLANQEKLLEVLLNYLLSQYPEMQNEYGYDKEERNAYMPNVDAIVEFSEIIRPKRIHILDVEKDGFAYLGIHFWCLWDEECELGFMMHKERIVEMGGGNSAFLSWIAEDDKENQ